MSVLKGPFITFASGERGNGPFRPDFGCVCSETQASASLRPGLEERSFQDRKRIDQSFEITTSVMKLFCQNPLGHPFSASDLTNRTSIDYASGLAFAMSGVERVRPELSGCVQV